LNEAGHIESCIRSLIDGDVRLAHALVVVVDGGSTDGTREIVRSMMKIRRNLRLIANPERLQAAGINLAVRENSLSDHLYLVRCDAHARYPQGYIQAVVKEFASRDVASVTTVMDAVGDNCFGRAVAAIVDTKLGSGGSAHRGGNVSRFVDHGHHAGMRLDWFRRIGGYDPTFVVNEDADYDYRLRQAGGRIWQTGTVRLDYVVRSTPQALAQQYFRYGRGRARTILTHRMRPRLRQLLPVVNVVLIALSPGLALVHPLFLGWPLLYLAVLAYASIWVALRLGSLCGLLAGPALATMHISWGAGFLSRLASRRS